MAPRSGMQIHTQGVSPQEPRVFLIGLGLLELYYRAKGMEQTCGCDSAFTFDWETPP